MSLAKIIFLQSIYDSFKSSCHIAKLLRRTKRKTSPGKRLLMPWEEEVLAKLKCSGGSWKLDFLESFIVAIHNQLRDICRQGKHWQETRGKIH